MYFYFYLNKISMVTKCLLIISMVTCVKHIQRHVEKGEELW